MRKRLFFTLLLSILMTAPALAWWPSEHYCTFIPRFSIDKTWDILPVNEDWYVTGSRYDETQKCRMNDTYGWIAWSIFTWDNRCDNGDDYELDYVRLWLKNGATGATMPICYLDFYPEDNRDNSWWGNWTYEGNYNPNLHEDYSNTHTYYVKKRLYSWDDGIQYCYFMTQFGDNVRNFIREAGSNLKIQIKYTYDDAHWQENRWAEAYLDPADRQLLDAPSTPTITIDGFEEKDGKTQVHYTPSSPENGCKTVVNSYYNLDYRSTYSRCVTMENPSSYGAYWDLNGCIDRSYELSEARGGLVIHQEHCYTINKSNYVSTDINSIPDQVVINSGESWARMPQLCLPRNIRVQPNASGEISISWTTDAPNRSLVDESQWEIARCKDGQFNSQTTKIIHVAYDRTRTSYTAKDTLEERDKGTVRYYYRVRRDRAIANPFAEQTSVEMQSTRAKITAFHAESQNGNVILNWTVSDGLITPDMKLQLTNNGRPVTLPSDLIRSGNHTITGLRACVPDTFRLQLMDNNAVYHADSSILTIPNDRNSTVSSLVASKGYYNNRVRITWTINPEENNFTQFTLKRRKRNDESNTSEMMRQLGDTIFYQNGHNEYSYDDNTALSGNFYEYILEGYSRCDTVLNTVAHVSDIGFVSTRGVVSGQILYSTGQALENAVIDVSSSNYRNDRALQLQGKGYAILSSERVGSVLSPTAGTIEMWLRPDNTTDAMPIAWVDGALCLKATNELLFELKSPSTTYQVRFPLQDTAVWNDYAYHHVAATYRQFNDSLIMTLSIGGKPVAVSQYTGVTRALLIGTNNHDLVFGNEGQTFYKGYLDEIRIWNTCRDSAMIATGFNRLLAGNETGLTAYYRCDEPINSALFDAAYTDADYHGNDLRITDGQVNGNLLPTADQLSLRAYTDSKGNYLINAIPYSASGTQYQITPRYGAHQFEPEVRSLFFDTQASTHNTIDFTDNSAFTVSGTICYAGGTFPVEGVQFKIDGSVVLSRKGGSVQTDENGEFSIQVPVGIHSVQAFMDGHVLQNDGYITDADGNDFNYQSTKSDIRIADSTKVRLIGRVAGGTVQTVLPVGHTVSRNNLGDGILVELKPETDKYKLTTTPHEDTLVHQTPSIYRKDAANPKRRAVPVSNRVEWREDKIVIHVNDSTGEFYADVCPINYRTAIKNIQYKDIEGEGSIISLKGMTPKTTMSEPRMYVDSLWISDDVNERWSQPEKYYDTVRYAAKQVFSVRCAPTIECYQIDGNGKKLPYFGVDSIQVPTATGSVMFAAYDSLRPDTARYTMGMPVFVHNRGYDYDVRVSEIYRHYLSGSNEFSWSDSVPTTDAQLEFTNTMAIEQTTRLNVDSASGKARYSFSIGEPNLTNAKGQMKLVVYYNGRKNSQAWNGDYWENGYGYYTGSHQRGSSCISAGPNNLLTVLRDPPGAGSYSWLDKGTTIRKTRSYNYKAWEEGKLGAQLEWGFKSGTFIGLGFALYNEATSTVNVAAGWHHANDWNHTTSEDVTYTLTEKFQTSSSELFVGPMADVFVGEATNIAVAEVDMVTMVDSAEYRRISGSINKVYFTSPDGQYRLVHTTGISAASQFATTFAYTRADIINVEIPNCEQILRSILVPYSKTDSTRLQAEANNKKELRYMLLPGHNVTDSDLGEEGTYFIIYPRNTSAGQTGFKSISDSVQTVRGWLNGWKFYLGMDEYRKWKAIDANRTLVKNYSLSPGTSLTLTENYSTAMTYSYSKVSKNNFFITEGNSASYQNTAFVGLNLLFEENAGNEKTRNWGTTSTHNHSKGFSIVPDASERLSVDVLHEADWTQAGEEYKRPSWDSDHKQNGNDVDKVVGKVEDKSSYSSFVFYTQGGQTCCPYEPEVRTEYIEHYLKMQIEADSVSKNQGALNQHKGDLAKLMRATGGVKLSNATKRVDRPRLTADQSLVDGVPSGESAYITLHLMNETESETNDSRGYYIILKEESNPNGARLSIDGTSIGTGLTGGSGVSYLVPAGGDLQKTLEVQRGSVLNYDNLTLYMVPSYCNSVKNRNQIKDSCSFSVRFTPTCTDVQIVSPSANWVYNTQLDTIRDTRTGKTVRYMPVTLGGYNLNYSDFERLELQYKPSSDGDRDWRRLHCFFRDSTGLNAAVKNGIVAADNASICPGGEVTYRWMMDALDDQNYDLRAVSYCRIGQTLVENPSEVVSGVKDTYRPRLFGSAKPANGILTAKDEIRIDFNEDIAGGLLTANNFVVTGVPNEAVINEHRVSLHLNSAESARTDAEFHLSNNYTIECWLRPTDLKGAQKIWTIGEGSEQLALTVDGETKMATITCAKQTYNVKLPTWKKNEWQHLAIRSEKQNTACLMYLLLDAEPIEVGTVSAAGINGRLTIGGGYIGDMHQFRVWTQSCSQQQIQVRRFRRLAGTTLGLLSCYPMDEGFGSTLSDISSGRTMAIHGATWSMPAGRALTLDGKSCAVIPFATEGISSDEDYTLECWFRTSSHDAQTLLSTVVTDSVRDANDLFIVADGKGNLAVATGLKGYVELAGNYTYADGIWHRLTLSVSRSTGFGRLYLDGELRGSLTRDYLGGLGDSRLYLGARADYKSSTGVTTTSSYWKGEIDELSLRAIYRPQYQVEACVAHKTDTAAVGLRLFYPMERYTTYMGVQSMTASLQNMAAGRSNQTMTLSGATISADASAPVAQPEAQKTYDHQGYTFTPNNQSIVFDLTAPLSEIEHTILTFTAADVRDTHGNKMESPVTWSVYVDLNPLTVSRDRMELTTPVNETVTTQFDITNRGGSYRNFAVRGVPEWMELNMEQGTIAPDDNQTILMTIPGALPIGTHTAHLYVEGDDDVSIPVTVTVVVEGEFAYGEVDPAMKDLSMNILAKLRFDGIYSNDTRDVLAAYDGRGRCVGSAHTAYNKTYDDYYVSLTVFSDTLDSHSLYYIMYDASTGATYAANCTSGVFFYSNNAIIGTPANPVVFYESANRYRRIPLSAGWNWISLNLIPAAGSSVNQVLSTEQWTSQDKIKTYNGFRYADYSARQKSWVGTLERMDSLRMYKLYSAEDNAFVMVGAPIDPQKVTIPVNNGWNAISFLPQSNMSVKEAMSGYSDPQNDDVIKSQNEFAIYYNGSWTGSLQTLRPGYGYMLRRTGTTAATLRYPQVNSNSSSKAPARIMHETSMSMVTRAEGIETLPGDRLTAYVGTEQVGQAVLTDGMWYISIAGDYNAETLYFVLDGAGIHTVSRTSVTYCADAVLGSPADPFVLEFADSPESIGEKGNSLVVYPNPADAVLYYRIDNPLSIEVFDAAGSRVMTDLHPSGSLSVGSLPSGTYMLRAVTEEGVYYCKFMKE